MNLQWKAESTLVTNGNLICERFDTNEYDKMAESFKKIPVEDRAKFKGLDDYVVKSGGLSLTPLRSNFKRICDEVYANIEKDEYYTILPVNIYLEKDTIMDLLASLENENYIKEIYKKKKLKVTGGLNTETSVKLIDCLRQGRSLLQSARVANMLSKPLIDFYAASAFAFASIVINSPMHKSLDTLKGSHGFTYNHVNESVIFGGDIPSGTFIDMLVSNYVSQIITHDAKLKYSTISSIEYIQKHQITLSILALLSMVPELYDQVALVDPTHKSLHLLRIRSEVVARKVSYVFEIGDGKCRPNIDILKRSFNIRNSGVEDIGGKYKITIHSEDVSKIMPTIYQDITGMLWYVESPIEGLFLPEVCLHFLIIGALCNIMRYSPHEWNNILSNKPSSDFSLLISKYLRLFELKYPMLLAQQFSEFLPIINY